MNYVYGWWFSHDNFLPHGDGREVVVGETLTVTYPLEMCLNGLHFSRTVLEALQYAPGPILHMVRGSGEVLSGQDKFCAEQRLEIARIDATDLLHEFARKCAWDVIHLWPAPRVVKQYLKTGNKNSRAAAKAAAWAAAGDAAGAAVRAAARAAAGDAAWNARDAARAVAWTEQSNTLEQMALVRFM